MTSEMIFQPLLAGLSVGAFCLTYCFPFMGSFLTVEDRPFKKNTLIVLQFLGGRLAGYLCIGILAGYSGEKLNSGLLRLMTDISFLLLSLILFLYLVGLVREKNPLCAGSARLKGKSPFTMGFLMGINLCPPFLLAVSYVISQHYVLYGMIYFFLFFLSSSIYFLPLIFVGFLARTKEFRFMARLSGFVVAGIFFIYGIYSILHNIH
ncbi:MAG TPA: sulfite exporter TauE/SafE family protein [Candidatus Omnitrophota bacterium]|nr:sulfite exporter TauE/SafE family protein [Candidatus Omnitrophota bacterium]